MEPLVKELRQFLVTSGFLDDGMEVGDEESLLERGIIDSLAVVEITEFMRTQYNYSVPQNDLIPENFDSIATMAAYLNRAQISGQ